MGIRQKTEVSSIDAFFKKAHQILFDNIFAAFAKLGEECVVRIRDRSFEESWSDHTANLRSSIGYAIYEYGKKKIESAFETIKTGLQGSAEGKKMVADLANEYSKVFALVVVAGMNYAEYVEAIESKDVLASTELWAKSVVDERLKRAVDDAAKKINKLKI